MALADLRLLDLIGPGKPVSRRDATQRARLSLTGSVRAYAGTTKKNSTISPTVASPPTDGGIVLDSLWRRYFNVLPVRDDSRS